MKKALVTGASEGIGRAFAKRLAKEGFAVTAVARGEARLRELVSELGPGGHAYVVADLSAPEGVGKVVAELEGGDYRLLVNNAGYSVYGPFHEAPLAALQDMMRVNCDALIALSHAYVRQAKSGDALINVSSGLAFSPMPHNGLYSATKALVTSLSESLWYEQRSRGVYVLGLCPGITYSKFHERASGGSNDELPRFLSQTPEQVVEYAMRELASRRRPTAQAGWKNLLLTSLPRFLTRKTTVTIMGRGAEGKLKAKS